MVFIDNHIFCRILLSQKKYELNLSFYLLLKQTAAAAKKKEKHLKILK